MRVGLGWLVAGTCLLTSCEEADKVTTAPKARSQAVVAEPTPTSAPAAQPQPSQKEVKPTRTQALCSGQLDQPGHSLSNMELERKTAAKQEPLPAGLPVGKGRWTWLNFWAAWCVPCREEIPRLRRWEGELNELEVVFVSLDDDERQLDEFLEKQPAAGLKRTYWLKDAEARAEWFASVKLGADPELPAHVLVDPKGMARCVVVGAVEDTDFTVVKKIVSGGGVSN